MKMPQVVYLVLPPEKMTKYGKHRSAPRVWLVARSNQAWLAPVSQAPHSLVMYMQHGIVWMPVRLEPGHPQMMFGCPYVLQHSKVTCKLVCLISCMHARFGHLLHLVVRIPLSRSWDGSNYIQLQVTITISSKLKQLQCWSTSSKHHWSREPAWLASQQENIPIWHPAWTAYHLMDP